MSVSSFSVRSKPKYKIILLGDQSVGKSCLIQRFVNGKFDQIEAPTVGIDFVVTNMQYKGKQYRLQLWDTAGQQRFKSLIPSYLRDTQCAIIVYDVSNKESYKNVQKWLDMYRQNSEQNSLVIIVGNKTDSKSRFSGYGQNHANLKKQKIHHVEVSAKTGHNIQELFNQIIQMIHEKESMPILNDKILDSIQESQEPQNPDESYNNVKITLSPKKDRQSSFRKEGKRQKCC